MNIFLLILLSIFSNVFNLLGNISMELPKGVSSLLLVLSDAILLSRLFRSGRPAITISFKEKTLPVLPDRANVGTLYSLLLPANTCTTIVRYLDHERFAIRSIDGTVWTSESQYFWSAIRPCRMLTPFLFRFGWLRFVHQPFHLRVVARHVRSLQLIYMGTLYPLAYLLTTFISIDIVPYLVVHVKGCN